MTKEMIMLEAACKKKGYAFFTKGDYNLNTIIVRAEADNTNRFDDMMYVVYNVNGVPCMNVFPCTADPGKSSLKNPHNAKGCARLCATQVRGSHQVGLHKGRPAMRQVKGFPYQRDNTRMGIHHQDGAIHDDIIFANIHDTVNENDGNVDGQSEGCPVLRHPQDLMTLLRLVRKQEEHGMGNKISLTILDAGDDISLKELL